MASKPTTVSKIQAELARRGFNAVNGYHGKLDPTAADDGHLYYSESDTVYVHDVSVDISERWSEPRVEMSVHVDAGQIESVARALAETHKSARHPIGVKVIVSPTTCIAVCEALRGA